MNTPTPPTPLPPLQNKPALTTHQAAMPKRHHRLRWTFVAIGIFSLLILATGGWLAYRAISVINTKKADGTKLSFLQQLTHLVTTNGDQLQGESDDRVNILLLGYGGPGHDGPYLTDTMMVASFKPSTKQLALISIPRDLVVNIPGYDYRKINSVLSFGRDDHYPGGGEALAVRIVSDTLNLPIQYYARIDFQGFKEVIDQVGGVTVTVDTTFSDPMYPDNGIGYDPISFKAGTQTMNGEKALKFARSRHGNNGEGSDFARAKRQQKIIEALKEKLFSFGTLTNPKKISDILTSLGTHTQTNMEVWEMLRLGKLAGDLKTDSIINRVYDDSTNGFLRAATGTGGAFILVPRDGDYHDMQFLARNVFLDEAAVQERANVLVVNATSFSTLGTSVGRTLEQLGLNVLKTQSLTTTVGQTVIVAAQPEKYAKTEQLLTMYAKAVGTLSASNWQQQTGDSTLINSLSTPITVNTNTTVVTNGRPVTTNTSATIIPDLIIVLGQDQPKPTSTSLFSTTTTNTSTNANTNSTKTTNTNTKVTNTNRATNTNTTTNTNTKTTNTTNGNNNTNSYSSVSNTNTRQ